ncbi:hypothetical protein [Stenomitos frigidus]|uniref:Uncharacterized protein n=1 Tax=Stenomitos frigidus ULC18 TaxID=2107698 RepID=A0A2T1DU87_9CYAN|nr:hypothetical protein [Stenomitos frigidus]PSB23991.1 hypothetical protein C7B82_28975 [Stenomitos frigidus ULC18]
MSVQKIQLEALQKIRQHIQHGFALPESENHPRSLASFDEAIEIPEPDSLSGLGDLFNFGSAMDEPTHAPNTRGEWFISATNPGSVLQKLPGLTLKPDVRLVCYLHRQLEEGRGVIWAVPESLSTTAQLEKALAGSGDSTHPPCPAGAFTNLMEAVEGDHSAVSFIIASLLQRELAEFGCFGKASHWSHHRLIKAVPAQAQWQWKIEIPKDLSPKVLLFADGRAAIEFFSCRVVPPLALFQHLDQYSEKNYKATVLDRAIAIAQRT